MKTGPKDFFLWAGAMISLYVSVFSFISLLFSYIDYAYPDALNRYFDIYSSSIRFEMASLIVLFPIFLLLMHLIRRDIRNMPEKSGLWVRRWFLVLTVFIAGATVAIDLITLINNFLNGELTLQFFLKVAVVFLVAGAGFVHFYSDLRGYWERNPYKVRLVGYGSGVAVICAILTGFIIMGAPWNVRLYRFDEQKVSDLQNIQSEILSYWTATGKLPATLADLNDSIAYNVVPVDPQSGKPYEYITTGAHSFELCATFNAETRTGTLVTPAAPVPAGAYGSPIGDNWYHSAGRDCFTRAIDPNRYPPVKK